MVSESNKPVSIIIPSKDYSEALKQISQQIKQKDELIAVCDTDKDPLAQKNLPENVKLIIAGEPKNCSGKANAIYAGMTAANNDLVAWTDADFEHPDNWLEQLKEDYKKHGSISELPFFIGKNPFSKLNEPILALVMIVTYLNNQAWGGSLLFNRTEFDEEEFLGELKRTIGDDVLLSEHLQMKTLRRTRTVEIGSTNRETLERITRFMKNVRYHEPLQTGILTTVSVLISLSCIIYPIATFASLTAAFAAFYAFLGKLRWTFLLSYPAFLILPILIFYGLLRKTFVWHGRRYRQKSKFNVEVLPK